MAQKMDPREARFLASQAERLSVNKKLHSTAAAATAHPDGGDADDAPELIHEEVNNVSSGGIGSKERNRLFWKDFRSLCSEFRNEIDASLLLPSPCPSDSLENASTSSEKKSNKDYSNAKAHYVTAARRNEGRIELDHILRNVRCLQRHVLSSSSSVSTAVIHDGDTNSNKLLKSILQSPMAENVTQTDIRLLSREIDEITKRIDAARDIICPKEKFVFRRYRKAMEERENLDDVQPFTMIDEPSDTKEENDKLELEKDSNGTRQDSNIRSENYGGVLENLADCIVEISSNGCVIVNKTSEEYLQYYRAPRRLDALHPMKREQHLDDDSRAQQQPNNSQESSLSYLLQNLQNVTVLLYGARPSLHLQNIRNCQIYVAEPTHGPVHVTNCHSSEVRCSCYQLRVHDSKDVKFGVWVRSGPIIEDCTGMIFGGNYYSDSVDERGGDNEGTRVPDRNMFWDVKDFNWLRALRKSPNFVVVRESTTRKEDNVSTRNSRTEGGESTPVIAVSTENDTEDDSEDEL
mmetsp:Transcript_3746/g.8271  ORF Transcript_3746/g.8271 Transcript_3746/m.8271 type:complete len:520 (-) Transcript_3746:166-1725(-)